jgi:hypothetical protein
MTKTDIATYKFGSGLTMIEAEALVDRLVSGYDKSDPEFVIHMLKSHLTRCVRDHKIEREIVTACAAG